MILSPLPLRTSEFGISGGHLCVCCAFFFFCFFFGSDAIVCLFFSWQPERQVPFSDVRMPPPADAKKEIREGEEVEVWTNHFDLLAFFPLLLSGSVFIFMSYDLGRSFPGPMMWNLVVGGWLKSAWRKEMWVLLDRTAHVSVHWTHFVSSPKNCHRDRLTKIFIRCFLCSLILYAPALQFFVIEYAACDAVYNEIVTFERLRPVNTNKAITSNYFHKCTIAVPQDLQEAWVPPECIWHIYSEQKKTCIFIRSFIRLVLCSKAVPVCC